MPDDRDTMPLADAEAMLRHWSAQSGYFASARAARTLLVELRRLRAELAQTKTRELRYALTAALAPRRRPAMEADKEGPEHGEHCGGCRELALLTEVARLRAELAEERARRTLGGVPPPAERKP
jgi:hypothetical protein